MRTALCLLSIAYRRTGTVLSTHELRSITVGTIRGKPARLGSGRRRLRDALAPGTTFGRSGRGVWSIGDGASLPWKVRPTTITSIAPFASDAIACGSRFVSAEPKRFATVAAAAGAPRRDAL